MLKKTIKYTNFNDEEVEEDFYFNMTEPELLELNFEKAGGFGKWLKDIAQMNDNHLILQQFKRIILMSIGKKSLDGSHFVKNDEIRAEFESHAAYPVLYMEMLEDSNVAADFIMGVVPKKLAEQAAEGIAELKREQAKAAAQEGASS